MSTEEPKLRTNYWLLISNHHNMPLLYLVRKEGTDYSIIINLVLHEKLHRNQKFVRIFQIKQFTETNSLMVYI